MPDHLIDSRARASSQPRSNKKQQSRERSVQLIFETALKLFVSRGYANTTVDQIADACGLTKGAVYHYFPGKEDLLLGLLDQVENEAIALRDTRGQLAGETAAQWLDRYIRTQAIHATKRPDAFLFLVVLSADMSNSPRVAQRIEQIFAGMREMFEQIVQIGQSTGEFSSNLAPQDFGLFWISAFSGNVLHWHRSGRQESIGRALVRALRLAVVRALTTRIPDIQEPPKRR